MTGAQHVRAEVQDLALDFDALVDNYIAADRWDDVQTMEQVMLLSYGDTVMMRDLVDRWRRYLNKETTFP